MPGWHSGHHHSSPRSTPPKVARQGGIRQSPLSREHRKRHPRWHATVARRVNKAINISCHRKDNTNGGTPGCIRQSHLSTEATPPRWHAEWQARVRIRARRSQGHRKHHPRWHARVASGNHHLSPQESKPKVAARGWHQAITISATGSTTPKVAFQGGIGQSPSQPQEAPPKVARQGGIRQSPSQPQEAPPKVARQGGIRQSTSQPQEAPPKVAHQGGIRQSTSQTQDAVLAPTKWHAQRARQVASGITIQTQTQEAPPKVVRQGGIQAITISATRKAPPQGAASGGIRASTISGQRKHHPRKTTQGGHAGGIQAITISATGEAPQGGTARWHRPSQSDKGSTTNVMPGWHQDSPAQATGSTTKVARQGASGQFTISATGSTTQEKHHPRWQPGWPQAIPFEKEAHQDGTPGWLRHHISAQGRAPPKVARQGGIEAITSQTTEAQPRLATPAMARQGRHSNHILQTQEAPPVARKGGIRQFTSQTQGKHHPRAPGPQEQVGIRQSHSAQEAPPKVDGQGGIRQSTSQPKEAPTRWQARVARRVGIRQSPSQPQDAPPKVAHQGAIRQSTSQTQEAPPKVARQGGIRLSTSQTEEAPPKVARQSGTPGWHQAITISDTGSTTQGGTPGWHQAITISATGSTTQGGTPGWHQAITISATGSTTQGGTPGWHQAITISDTGSTTQGGTPGWHARAAPPKAVAHQALNQAITSQTQEANTQSGTTVVARQGGASGNHARCIGNLPSDSEDPRCRRVASAIHLSPGDHQVAARVAAGNHHSATEAPPRLAEWQDRVASGHPSQHRRTQGARQRCIRPITISARKHHQGGRQSGSGKHHSAKEHQQGGPRVASAIPTPGATKVAARVAARVASASPQFNPRQHCSVHSTNGAFSALCINTHRRNNTQASAVQ
eukprot:gene28580-31747_t